MADIPADAQRSEDGHYWWDGSQWQPVDQSQGAADQAGQAGQDQGAAASSSSSDGQQDQSVAMTDDHFQNMLTAAEQDVVEA
jgi:hypothetical protein